MKTNQPSLLPGFLSYALGVTIGLFLLTIATWANMESTFYGFPRLANAGLRGFSCPVLMTEGDTGTISLDISNPTDRPISPAVRTEISTRALPQQFVETFELAPGESRRLEWSVGPENRDLGYFILAKTLVYSAHPLPSQETTCGIFVLNLPGSGQVILVVLVALSLLGMGWGLYQINKSRSSQETLGRHRSSMILLAFMIVVGLVISFRGVWIFSLFILIIVILLILLSSLMFIESRRSHR